MRGPVEWFYNKVASHQQTSAGGVVRGYEVTMTEGRKAREQGYLAFDKLFEHGACIAGDPQECIGRLKRKKEGLVITELVLWSNMGGMTRSAELRVWNEFVRQSRQRWSPNLLKILHLTAGSDGHITSY